MFFSLTHHANLYVCRSHSQCICAIASLPLPYIQAHTYTYTIQHTYKHSNTIRNPTNKYSVVAKFRFRGFLLYLQFSNCNNNNDDDDDDDDSDVGSYSSKYYEHHQRQQQQHICQKQVQRKPSPFSGGRSLSVCVSVHITNNNKTHYVNNSREVSTYIRTTNRRSTNEIQNTVETKKKYCSIVAAAVAAKLTYTLSIELMQIESHHTEQRQKQI